MFKVHTTDFAFSSVFPVFDWKNMLPAPLSLADIAFVLCCLCYISEQVASRIQGFDVKRQLFLKLQK